ncbi:Scr1 family TA system antitoxin-like transcriptional regulator [Streptomyces tendae]|uniref:Scr1 family TA system antitoxin-like transcriptional regulator n=1 Tax=Streptomyces tendae TaxID=1932 RepID=UPI00367EA99C
MSSSSSVQQAREALGKRLREIRKDSGLTARDLAARAGWHESKCSRIENGRTPPSDDDLRVYTLYCAAADQTADLIATARNIDGAYVEWRRMERSGLRRAQESVMPLWERTRHFRAYSSWLIPGPFQTPAYIRALLMSIRDRRALPDDLEEAVGIRVDKQRVLYEGGRRFAVVLEESTLRHLIGGPETMAGQLGHLLSLAALPNVSLGVVPLSTDRTALWPVEDGRAGAIWAQRVHREDFDDSLSVTAHLFQAEVPKGGDVRVTVVGRRVFAQRITDPRGAVDWRSGDWNDLVHTPVAVPSVVETALHGYLAASGLVFGCFDFALTGEGGSPEDWWAIECNPNGQWGWLPDAPAITEAFADILSMEGISSSS